MKTLILTLAGLWALATPAMAQDEAPKHLRFIPLGERPVPKQRIKNNIRVLDPAPPGTMPPQPVSLVSGGEVIPFDLSFSNFSKLLTMNGATKKLEIKKGEVPEGPSWIQSSKPSAPLSLGVLYADPKTMLWNKPKMLLLDDDGKSFPAGQMRFVNVSEKVIYVRIGGRRGQVFGLAPGKPTIRDLKVGVNLIKVISNNPQSNEPEELVWESQFTINANQRVQSFFYKALPRKGAKPVKFQYSVETVPKLPGK